MAERKSPKKQRKRSIPARKIKIASLLKEKYKKPVSIQNFLKKHLKELGWSNDKFGFHSATVYLNRMAKQNELTKEKRGRDVYISITKDSPLYGITTDVAKKADVETLLNPEARRKKIIEIVSMYDGAVPLAYFIKNHAKDIGYSSEAQQLATLRAFMYRMDDKKLVRIFKKGTSLYISLTDFDVEAFMKQKHTGPPRLKEGATFVSAVDTQVLTPKVEKKKTATPAKKIKDVQEREATVVSTVERPKEQAVESAPVETQTATPSRPTGVTPPISIETLIETKYKIMLSIEELDLQLEQIIEKKKALKKKRDEIFAKIAEHFV